jgi:hypothetical protein
MKEYNVTHMYINMSDPLYVRYRGTLWEPFIKTKDNFHRQDMVEQFITLNTPYHTFDQFPHAKGGTLTATVAKTSTEGMYTMTIEGVTTEYMYGKPEYFAYINRVMGF